MHGAASSRLQEPLSRLDFSGIVFSAELLSSVLSLASSLQTMQSRAIRANGIKGQSLRREKLREAKRTQSERLDWRTL